VTVLVSKQKELLLGEGEGREEIQKKKGGIWYMRRDLKYIALTSYEESGTSHEGVRLLQKEGIYYREN